MPRWAVSPQPVLVQAAVLARKLLTEGPARPAMNKRGHVVNAVLLSLGVGYILEPRLSPALLIAIVQVAPPIVLGALFPDLDTAFGDHRKTFHNIWVLGFALAFPYFFNNLHYVWIGITTHYVLDLLGNVKGMGLFYPLPGFFDIPVGVNINSKWADVVTLAVTAFELVLLAGLAVLGHQAQFATPQFPSSLGFLIEPVVA